MVNIVTLAKMGPRIISCIALSVSKSTAEVAISRDQLKVPTFRRAANLHPRQALLTDLKSNKARYTN